MPTKMCNVRIPDEIADRYDVLANKTGRTKTFYLRQAIEGYIEDLEDAYAGVVVMERIRMGKEELVELDEWENGLSGK